MFYVSYIMNIERKEEKDLVCEYFNPTSKLTIYDYSNNS